MAGEVILAYDSIGTQLSGSSETTCYTCPANTWAQVSLIRICDNAGGSGSARVAWGDASAGATYALIHGGVFSANTALTLTFDRLALSVGDTIKVTGANGYHVVVSVIQYASRRA